jgi:hypothetical protein
VKILNFLLIFCALASPSAFCDGDDYAGNLDSAVKSQVPYNVELKSEGRACIQDWDKKYAPDYENYLKQMQDIATQTAAQIRAINKQLGAPPGSLPPVDLPNNLPEACGAKGAALFKEIGSQLAAAGQGMAQMEEEKKKGEALLEKVKASLITEATQHYLNPECKKPEYWQLAATVHPKYQRLASDAIYHGGFYGILDASTREAFDLSILNKDRVKANEKLDALKKQCASQNQGLPASSE